MGLSQNLKHHYRFSHVTISYLILLLSLSSQSIFFSAQGRKLSQITENSKTVNEEKVILRGRIGSRPPRCNGRCSSCTHCEAIQVPTNPQIKNGIKKNSTTVETSVAAYATSYDSSNYKPMSWKCKCGNLIFNP